MGVAGPKVKRASKMHLLSLLPLLCIVSAAPEGGLFGFGLLGGDSTTNTTTTTAPSTTPSASTTTALVEALTSTTAASSSDTSGIIQNLIDVLTGKVATIALDQLSSLLGLNNPVPSPLADPVGFLTHPLITPILLGAITLNPAALALAMGGLAGNLVLTHMFTMASEGLLATTTAAVVAY